MKKALAILMAVLMMFALFACNKTTSGTDESAVPSPSATESAAPESSAPTDGGGTESDTDSSEAPTGEVKEMGFYDPGYDYSANRTYKFVYMISQTGVLYDMFNAAFAEWAKLSNVEYSHYCANSDNDLFLTTIETYASQGVDGYLFDADNTIYPAVKGVMDDLGLPWISCMAEPLDDDGNRSHPVAGFDNYKFGTDMAEYVIGYAQETWPDADPSVVGMLSMDFSLSPQIHVRTEASKEIFLAAGYPEENFFVADGASTGLLNADTGYNISGPIFASNPQIEYWLICACLDDYADGATRVAEQNGLADKSIATTCGGSGLINHWDAGEDSSWKSAVYCAQTLFAEPIFFALYAFVNGDTTPEDIWPEWKQPGEAYAYHALPTFIIEKDTYKEYMEWVDQYTGINWSPYDDEYQGTQFEATMTPSF